MKTLGFQMLGSERRWQNSSLAVCTTVACKHPKCRSVDLVNTYYYNFIAGPVRVT
jgi:hypothetical protein